MQTKGKLPFFPLLHYLRILSLLVNCMIRVRLVVFQLGANAILAVSLAVCKAGASVKKIPLYKVHWVYFPVVDSFRICFS